MKTLLLVQLIVRIAERDAVFCQKIFKRLLKRSITVSCHEPQLDPVLAIDDNAVGMDDVPFDCKV